MGTCSKHASDNIHFADNPGKNDKCRWPNTNLNLFEALSTLQSLGILHNNLIETVNNDKNKLYVYYRLQ